MTFRRLLCLYWQVKFTPNASVAKKTIANFLDANRKQRLLEQLHVAASSKQLPISSPALTAHDKVYYITSTTFIDTTLTRSVSYVNWQVSQKLL